jgi:LuxR family transcriptional regulator, maltose regulon positive regulatory protein
VLSYLAQGMSLAEVGKTIHLSVNTVKTHVKAIYRKLGVNSRLGAISAWKSAPPSTPAE